jgi:hypothetical protein
LALSLSLSLSITEIDASDAWAGQSWAGQSWAGQSWPGQVHHLGGTYIPEAYGCKRQQQIGKMSGSGGSPTYTRTYDEVSAGEEGDGSASKRLKVKLRTYATFQRLFVFLRVKGVKLEATAEAMMRTLDVVTAKELGDQRVRRHSQRKQLVVGCQKRRTGDIVLGKDAMMGFGIGLQQSYLRDPDLRRLKLRLFTESVWEEIHREYADQNSSGLDRDSGLTCAKTVQAKTVRAWVARHRERGGYHVEPEHYQGHGGDGGADARRGAL